MRRPAAGQGTAIGAGRLELLGPVQRQLFEDRRRQAEPARDTGVVDRRGIEQNRADRAVVETHVGEQLGCG